MDISNYMNIKIILNLNLSIILSLSSLSCSINNLDNQKISINNNGDENIGWYYYKGGDTSVIEIVEADIYYIGKDSHGYYKIDYKNSELKESNKPKLKICKIDSRDYADQKLKYLSNNIIFDPKYDRKLTQKELNNVFENLKTAEQSKELCDIG